MTTLLPRDTFDATPRSDGNTSQTGAITTPLPEDVAPRSEAIRPTGATRPALPNPVPPRSDAPSQAGAVMAPTPNGFSPQPEDSCSFLVIYSDALDDFEKVRIASENRLRSLMQAKDMEHSPEAARMRATIDALKGLEDGVNKDLERAMKAHPLGHWVKTTTGVGTKQGARLIATLGTNPYWHPLYDRPRTVSELWAFAGLHVAEGQAARRRKGQKANWSTIAKTRAYLVGKSCIMQIGKTTIATKGTRAGESTVGGLSPYRVIYDERRAHTAVTHADWTKGHSDSDARRIVSKAILRDLWIEGRRLHELGQL